MVTWHSDFLQDMINAAQLVSVILSNKKAEFDSFPVVPNPKKKILHMPIRDAPSTPKSWEDVEDSYVIFYASRGDDGVMWCPDCRAVEDLVKETFEKEGAPSAEIMFHFLF